MFRFAQRIKAIKKDLKRWSFTKFANYRVQMEKNTTKLQYVENKIMESLIIIGLTTGIFDWLNKGRN